MDGSIFSIMMLIFCLICLVIYLVRRWIFIRDHKVCPRCGNEMKVVWVGEELDAREKKVTFGGMRVLAGTVTRYTSVLRCSHCGHEISTGPDNSERG